MLAYDNVYDISQYTKSSYGYTNKTLSEEKKKKLLAEVVKNKNRWWNYYGTNLQQFRDDKFFYIGQTQWAAISATNYAQLGKIPYTFNLLKPIVEQLQGEMASMQPSISLSPINQNKIDPQLLILMTDFLRAEVYNSDAQAAYAQCFFNMCIGGWGVLEVETEYENEYSFDQKIVIKGAADPLLIGFDPSARDKSKIDGNFQFKDYYMSKEEFESTFNRPAPPPGQMLGTQRQFLPLLDNKTVIVTDYYKKDYKTKALVQLSNYDNYKIEVLEKDIETAQQHYMQIMTQSGMPLSAIRPLMITNRRKTKIATITCYKCIADDILETKVWPSKYLPFIYVESNSKEMDGRQYVESFINNAKDAQQSYNYVMSEWINDISRNRREKVWMTRTQAAGHEDFLRYPDRQQGHCEYNVDPMVPDGKPIFRDAEEIPQTLILSLNIAEQAVYKCLGIMPAQGSSELPNNLAAVTVGRLITQGNLKFVKLLNNLFDGMQQVGQTFLDLVPKIYDSERIVSAVDANGAARSERINTVENQKQKNMLSEICYKLIVKPVASFAIQQQELRQDMLQLAQLNPQFGVLLGDLIGSTFDSPIAPQISQRLKTMLPPNVAAQEKGLPPPPPPPPSPEQQLQMAQVAKAQADAKLSMARAQSEQIKPAHAQQQMQQDAAQAVMNYQLENEKLQASRDQTVASAQSSYIQSVAEIQKAQLDHNAKVVSALASAQKASKDASKQL